MGVNGSQRWCLTCLAEWPTAAAFLTEVSVVAGQPSESPTRRQLQNRFQHILAHLGEPELARIEHWLDILEAELEVTAEALEPNAVPLLEYA